jgi:hypothetical protein
VLGRRSVGVSSATSSSLAGGTTIPASFSRRTREAVLSYTIVLMVVKKNLWRILLTLDLLWVSASFNPHLRRQTQEGGYGGMTSRHPCRRPDRRWRRAETDQYQAMLGIGAQLSPVILTAGGPHRMFSGCSQEAWVHSQIIWVYASSYSHGIWGLTQSW